MSWKNGSTTVPASEWKAHVVMTLSILFLSASIIFGRAYHADVPPAGMAFWRAVTAFLVCLPFVYRDFLVQFRLALKHWKLMIAIGITQSVCGQIPFFLGLHTTTAVTGGLIIATQPVVIFLLAWLVLRDPMRRVQFAGLIIALTGVVAVVAHGDLSALLRLEFVAGDLLIQLSVVSWAAYFILIKRALDALSPMVLFEAMTLAAIVVLAPCYAAEILIWGEHTRFNEPTLITVLYLAIFASVIALVFFNIGIRRLGPGRAGAYNYLIPVFTALLAGLVLGEAIEPYHVIGLGLVCAGVFLTNRPVRTVSVVPK